MEAQTSPPEGAGTRRRVIVAATEPIEDQVVARVADQVRDRAEDVFVIAPAVVESAIAHEMADFDEGIADAQERLDRSLAALRDAGLEVDGAVGESDPVLAIGDELRKRDADEILLVAPPQEEARYAEKDLLARAQDAFAQPVTALEVEHRDGHEVVEARHKPPGRKPAGWSWRPSPNLPPFSARDVLGISIGLGGTAVLILLAAICASAHDGEIVGGCAARILIAIGAALVNLGHLVALPMMAGVRYRGIWQRFMSRLTIFGTPVAIVASLLVA